MVSSARDGYLEALTSERSQWYTFVRHVTGNSRTLALQHTAFAETPTISYTLAPTPLINRDF